MLAIACGAHALSGPAAIIAPPAIEKSRLEINFLLSGVFLVAISAQSLYVVFYGFSIVQHSYGVPRQNSESSFGKTQMGIGQGQRVKTEINAIKPERSPSVI
jgi:hypothetical protein